jgi:hypothetical protein
MTATHPAKQPHFESQALNIGATPLLTRGASGETAA